MLDPTLTLAAVLAAALLGALAVAVAHRARRARHTSHRPSARPTNRQPAWQPRKIRHIHEDPQTLPIRIVAARHAAARPPRFVPGTVGVTTVGAFAPIRSNGSDAA